MNKQTMLYGGIFILIIVAALIFYMPDASYKKEEHFFNVHQMSENEIGELFIIGKDPYVHNSEVVYIKVTEEEFADIEVGKTYMVKYSNSDKKGNRLIKYEERDWNSK